MCVCTCSRVPSTLVHFINPRLCGRRVTVLGFVCVCLLPQNCCLNSIISKSEHATALNLCKELAILLFYKADKFLKVELAQTTRKLKTLCTETR